jgi:phosphocarrier protein FPr
VNQLTAIVRTAHETPVSVMFPMVTSVEEARRGTAVRLDAAIDCEGRGRPAGLQVGIMVEVPATALKAAAFVPYVDSSASGPTTSPSTRWPLNAANPALAALADPLDPGVLRLVATVTHAAGSKGMVAVCGELAPMNEQRGCSLRSAYASSASRRPRSPV